MEAGQLRNFILNLLVNLKSFFWAKCWIENTHVIFKILGFKFKIQLCRNEPYQCLEAIYENSKEGIITSEFVDKFKKMFELYRKLPLLSKLTEIPIRDIIYWSDSIPNDYYNYFFSNKFEKYFPELIINLPENDKKLVKTIILRNLFISLLYKKDFYEPIEEKRYKDYLNLLNSECVNLKDCYKCGKYLFKNNNYEKNVLINGLGLEFISNKNELRKFDVIDLGACVGDSSFILGEYTDKKVYAFEPLEENYLQLCENIKLNNINNIVPIKMAAGEIKSMLPIYETLTGHESACIDAGRIVLEKFRNYKPTGLIEVTALDDFVSERNINVGLIKFDVEGCELASIKGALNVIKANKPILLISIYHKASDFFEIKSFIENLNLGYSFRVINNHPELFNVENILLCEVVNGKN